MPTYSYRCEGCGHALEVVQRMTEDALTDCPACQAPRLVKQIQAVGFALKGTGWYVTDFRDKGKKQPAADGAADTSASGAGTAETKTEGKGDGKTEGKTEGKGEGKTDGKTESKTESKTDTPKPAAAAAD